MRVLTIDLDETVWPCQTVIDRAEQGLYAWIEQTAPRLARDHSIESLRDRRLALKDSRPDLAHDITALRLESLGGLLDEYGYRPERAAEGLAVFMAERNRVQPFPDVAPVLQALAGRYWLVSVTNGNAVVAQTPLRGHFHYSLSAADVGAPKPQAPLFEAALRRVGAEPAEGVHIGDDPLLDVDAARRVGMRSVWVNRACARWPPELPPPDVEVGEFRGLAGWLASL